MAVAEGRGLVAEPGPREIDEAAGGVISRPSLIRNRFSDAPAPTMPSVVRPIPSAKPLRLASMLMSWLDR